MARKVMHVCDLHATDVPAEAELVVQLGEDRWRADLCAAHLRDVRKTLAPLLSAAHQIQPGGPGGSRTVIGSRRSRTAERAELREWARKHGYDVRDRGRVSAEVVAAYERQLAKKAERKQRAS